MAIARLENLDLEGKTLLIRQDLNVPVKDGVVVNDTRIVASLPTLELALARGAKVIVMSHLGRPEEGKAITEQTSLSMKPVAERLNQLLKGQVKVRLNSNYLIDPSDASPAAGEIVLLENIRVNKGEKANDVALAKSYAALCDIFVMDAFGTAHRAQASTHGVAQFAANACAGPLLSKELDALDRSLKTPERPMLAIVGGAKVSTKLEVLESLSHIVDKLMVGGGIANTFIAAAGHQVGKSLYEPDLLDVAKTLMGKTEIPLPTDVVVANDFSAEAKTEIKDVADIAANDMILDIGPASALAFAELINPMKTIIWNGPLGVFEFPSCANGTQTIAKAIAKNTGFSIAGGGETITAIDKFKVTNDISYISTGGGAFLEFVQGETLPAVAILDK